MTARSVKGLFLGLTLLIAGLGGIYFGLFSCGGIGWHRTAFLAGLAAAALIIPMPPALRRSPKLSRMAFLIGVFAIFHLFQLLAAPFYPRAPESWSEYFQLLRNTVAHGLC